MSKDELLKQIRTDRRQLERYLFFFEKNEQGEFVPSKRLKFSREAMLQRGIVDQLSVKDILSLLSGWETYFMDWYEHLRSGEDLIEITPGISRANEEEINQPILTDNKQRSLDEVLSGFRKSHKQIVKLIETIPEDELFSAAYDRGQSLTERISEVTWEHYRWAKHHIRIWSRAGTWEDKESILNSIETERRRLEKNLINLSDKEMVEPGVIGEWSVKDILAHLVDWEQRFLSWYQAGLRGEVPQTPAPGMTWGGLDKLNQMIFEEHKEQPLDEVKADFQNSYQQVLETVKAMPEDCIFQAGYFAWTENSNLKAYILANTANHYRWAKTQIRSWMRT
ncbi:MAG: ClbS/DfsB family four-helix bundle protein, partial [Anaerolineales bacterium]